jgi:quercetin dioxygenase-like cupin family protein
MTYKYFSDVKTKVIFSSEGPQPQNLFTANEFKIITVGLEAGQKIPIHPEGLAIYTFLEGNGWMIVDGERLPVGPGAMVITRPGTQRGINADNRLIFVITRISMPSF